MSITTEPIVSVPDMTAMTVDCTIFQIREFLGSLRDMLQMARAEHDAGECGNAHAAVIEALCATRDICTRMDHEIARWEEDMDRQAAEDRAARWAENASSAYESLPPLEIT